MSGRERGRSREKGREKSSRAKSAAPRGRRLSREVEKTARSLSAPGRDCSVERAKHVLEAHGSPELAAKAGRRTKPSSFNSKAEMRKAVGRARAKPDATASAGGRGGRTFAFKTFNRTIGRSGGHGPVRDAECDTVAVIQERGGQLVTAFPIPASQINNSAKGAVNRSKPASDPPSLLSDPSESLSKDTESPAIDDHRQPDNNAAAAASDDDITLKQ